MKKIAECNDISDIRLQFGNLIKKIDDACFVAANSGEYHVVLDFSLPLIIWNALKRALEIHYIQHQYHVSFFEHCNAIKISWMAEGNT